MIASHFLFYECVFMSTQLIVQGGGVHGIVGTAVPFAYEWFWWVYDFLRLPANVRSSLAGYAHSWTSG